MKRNKKTMLALTSFMLSAGLFLAPSWASAQGDVTGPEFRRVKPPASYGTVKMERNTKDSKTVKPVLFPHWAHRSKYSCKACHTDLGFQMKAGGTEIKQADIEGGKYCGKCHNGQASFAVSECEKCHSYGLGPKGSNIADALKDLPKDPYGNGVNWAAAVKENKIKPAANADGKGELNALDMDIIIPVTKFTPSPPNILFPHKAHTQVLECAACHPKPFNQKKGGNPEMNMMKIMAGQYCGACHGYVAFPLDDCFRCHSQPAPELKKEEKKDEKKDEKK